MMREITIKKVANGFIVVVGCQTFVFEKAESVAVEFLRYAANPYQIEKEYLSRCGEKPFSPLRGSTFQIQKSGRKKYFPPSRLS